MKPDDEGERKLPKFEFNRAIAASCLKYITNDNWNAAERGIVYHSELNADNKVVMGREPDIGLITIPYNEDLPGIPISLPERYVIFFTLTFVEMGNKNSFSLNT